jgi:hypothetical protein
MKKVLFVLAQLLLFIVFVLVFFGGSFLGLFHLDPFHARWFVSHPTADTVRYFVPTGLILMTLLYLVVFGIEAAIRKIRTAGLWTSIAFVVALIIGILYKFGWYQPS